VTGLAFKNNAKTTLSSGVNDSTTTIPVTDGSVFPQIDATDPALDVFFFATLDDDTNNEIVKVTASSGSSGNQNLTVVRAQESTSARAFSSGDKVELRLTAGMVDTFNLSGNAITLSSNKMGFGDSSPEVSLDLGAQTDSLHVPVGTTAQRPGSPEAGYLRYNSTTGKFEGYTNAWGDLADGSDFLVTNTYTTANASTTAFTISNAVQDEKQLLVFIDGVFQAHNSYSVSGTTVTLSTAPASGREVTIYSALSNLQGANMVIATMTGDNSDTTLDLGVTPVSENNVQVYIDGTYQNKSTYSISGQILTFSTAPPTGTAVEAITHTVLDISAAASSVLIDEFTGDGSDTTFTLSAAPTNENNTQVFVGGVYQEKATYSISNAVLTFTAAPANGVSIEVVSIAVGQINSAVQLADADGDTKVMVEESSDEDKIRFDTGGTERMIIGSNGKIGIGTTSTDHQLSVNAADFDGIQLLQGGTDTGYIGVYHDGSSTGRIYVGALSTIDFQTGNGGATDGTSRVRIDGNNVFLNGGTDARIQLGTGGAGANQVSNNTVHIRGDGVDMKFMAASGGSYLFEENGTERMRISSSTGHVGIGSSSPSSDLYVQSPDDSTCLFAAGGTYAFGINRQGASGTNYGWYQGTTASNTWVVYDGGGTGRFEVSLSSAGFISDRDQKENITDLAYGLETVKKLKPKKFKFKDVEEMEIGDIDEEEQENKEKRILEGDYNIGFIAQEMVEEVPEIVSGTDGQGDMKIDYAAFTSVLTKAIQEQQVIIDDLKARITTLEGS